MEYAIQLKNVTKTFGKVVANKNVNLDVKKGEILSLLGENGSGKTTLMNMISGIYFPDSGEIMIDGRKVEIRSPKDAYDLGIGMIHQHFKLIDVFSATENIALGLDKKQKFDLKEVRKKAQAICDRYHFDLDLNQKVYEMSVSQKQTLEIVKVLYRGANILILDEPTAVLTPQETARLFEVIRNMKADNKSVIIITHKLHEVLEISDRVAILRKGEYIGTVDTCEATENSLTEMMVGKKVSLNIDRPEPVNPRKRLEVQGVTCVNKEGVRTLDNATFTAYSGEILGVAGLQGHGQTELLNAVSGLYPLAGAEIIVNGKQVGIKNAGQAIANGIALVPSDRKNQGLMLELSNRHNLSISSMKKRMKGCFIDKKAEQAFSESMASKLSIKMGGLDLPVSSLSGGNQQKVVLGKELATEPRVILFDEPTRGIDVEAKREFYQIMHDLAARGVAVVMNSSDMLEVIGMSSRVIVMYEGRISGILEKAELTEERIMQLGMGLGKNRKEGEEG